MRAALLALLLAGCAARPCAAPQPSPRPVRAVEWSDGCNTHRCYGDVCISTARHCPVDPLALEALANGCNLPLGSAMLVGVLPAP